MTALLTPILLSALGAVASANQPLLVATADPDAPTGKKCFTGRHDLRKAIIEYVNNCNTPSAIGAPRRLGSPDAEDGGKYCKIKIGKYGWPMKDWCVSNVTDMHYLFTDWDPFPGGQHLNYFNEDLTGWDTSAVTNMKGMFHNNLLFNGDINTWDTSRVTSMSYMFKMSGYEDESAFNRDINSWDTSRVTNMKQMFNDATAFNRDINSWNTSRVTNMYQMFDSAWAFNNDVSSWNTSRVTNMKQMFNSAWAFNNDVSSWDLLGVTDMDGMFRGATKFNQNLCAWGDAFPISLSPANVFTGSGCAYKGKRCVHHRCDYKGSPGFTSDGSFGPGCASNCDGSDSSIQ